MSAVVFAFDSGRSYHRPWQNHELAEFYRAIDILGRAGLAVIPDMGVSDEGDPWFAFCRADTGDVVVHFARIDGLLVATSIASKDIVRGPELRNIIDAVIRLEPLSLPVANADRRLFLHPAVVLTAFIAAALAFSKQADAHQIHSNAAAKAAEPHAPFAKMYATLKAAASEVFGAGPVASVVGNAAENDQGGLNAPISLAALMSAAMGVIGTSADAVRIDPPSTETALALPPTGPDDHSSLHPLAITLLSGAHDGVAVPPQNDTIPAAITHAPHWPGDPDATAVFAPLAAPLVQPDGSTQPGPSFQLSPAAPAHPAVFSDYVVDHAGAPPPHIGTSAVIASVAPASDQSAPAVSETPDPAFYANLSTISPVALAILLGGSPSGLANTTSGAIPLLVGSQSTGDGSHNVATSSSAVASSPVSASIAAGPATSLAGSPATIIYTAANPAEALGRLSIMGSPAIPSPAPSRSRRCSLPIFRPLPPRKPSRCD